MIFVECDPDTILVKYLTKGKEIRHASGISKVCNRLADSTRCVGMVDEDPLSIQHPYIDKLKKDGQINNISACDLTILYDKSKNNQLVLICPRLEDWLLKSVKEAKLDIEKYFLPKKPSELHDILTLGSKNKKHMDNYTKLLSYLAESSIRVKTLKELLEKNG